MYISRCTLSFAAAMSRNSAVKNLSTISGTQFADSGADNGKMYNITDESATASSNGLDGDSYSKIQLDGSSENADTRQIIASFKVRKDGNLGGVTGTQVECVINPVNFQAW
jgi:hypothetical protein